MRRSLVILVIFLLLIITVVPLAITFSNMSNDAKSSPLSIQTMYRELNMAENPSLAYVPDEVIVKFGKRVAEEEIVGLRVGQGAEEVAIIFSARVWKVPPSRTVEEWVDFFDRHPLVEYAEPNFLRYAFWYPDDPLYGYQWHLDDDHTSNFGGADSNPYGGLNGGGIGMEEAWQIPGGSSNVVGQ